MSQRNHLGRSPRRSSWLPVLLLALALGGCTNALPSGLGESTPPLTMSSPRAAHGAVTLSDGRVLFLGGCVADGCEAGPASQTAEVFDPSANAFVGIGSMVLPRISAATALLADGRVLIAGGWAGRRGETEEAEIFDPSTGRFQATGAMAGPRVSAGVVELDDGRILLVGGSNGTQGLDSVEAYDPVSGSFEIIGRLTQARAGAEAVGLKDGRVLVVGGDSGRYGRGGVEVFAGAEIFDPATGHSRSVGAMSLRRHKHASVVLPDGRVLIVGGSDERDFSGRHQLLEIFDPETERFSAAGELVAPRFKLQAAVVVLEDGRVLIAGGSAVPEIYDPQTATSEVLDIDLGASWYFATANSLPDGRVLIAGGYRYDPIRLSDQAWVVEVS